MGQIEKMLEFNREFVENQEYLHHQTSKYPDKKIAIVTCMDTRQLTLLPAALGIKNGDVKMIKHPSPAVEVSGSQLLSASPSGPRSPERTGRAMPPGGTIILLFFSLVFILGKISIFQNRSMQGSEPVKRWNLLYL